MTLIRANSAYFWYYDLVGGISVPSNEVVFAYDPSQRSECTLFSTGYAVNFDAFRAYTDRIEVPMNGWEVHKFGRFRTESPRLLQYLNEAARVVERELVLNVTDASSIMLMVNVLHSSIRDISQSSELRRVLQEREELIKSSLDTRKSARPMIK